MLDVAYRNITRQRTRSFLTILGILIGIAAVVALGGVAEGINAMVEKSLETTAGKIMIAEEGSSMMTAYSGSEITEEQFEQLVNFPGIGDVIPMVFHMMGDQGFAFAQPEIAIGLDPLDLNYFKGEKVEMYEGRELEEGDSDVGIIGKGIADKYNYLVGDEFEIKDESFIIVGIVEETGNADIDQGFIVPIESLMDVLDADTYPFVFAVPEDIEMSEEVAEDIRDEFEEFTVISSTELVREVSGLINNMRFFTIGIGAIAAIVGGLGVMNTMIMAVMERKREIGVLKAIGATNTTVLMQFLTEAALLSVIGGVIGLLLGTFGAMGIGLVSGFAATPIVTPVLAVGAMIFAFLLGLVGGFYPARKASKLDPVEALRYE